MPILNSNTALMSAEDFSVLNLSRYQFRLRARQAVVLPPFLGSTLRGAFGHALKEAVCAMAHRHCQRCMLAERCIYPYIFETPAHDIESLRGQNRAPHPFILMPPIFERVEKAAAANNRLPKHSDSAEFLYKGMRLRLVKPVPAVCSDTGWRFSSGDELVFELILVGRAVEYMPYVVYAMSEMGKTGLGADRVRFDLIEVALVDEQGPAKAIYSGGQLIAGHDHANTKLGDLIRRRLKQLEAANILCEENLRLEFKTPVRIRVERDLQVNLNFELLVRNLLRRVSLLAVAHGSAPLNMDYRSLINLASGVKTRSSELRWWDWERYSNRQKTKMSLGGFAGEIEYEGEAIQAFMPLIAAGEMLQLGSGTSFGLGRYQIGQRNDAPAIIPKSKASNL
jgi:hypothetical protein